MSSPTNNSSEKSGKRQRKTSSASEMKEKGNNSSVKNKKTKVNTMKCGNSNVKKNTLKVKTSSLFRKRYPLKGKSSDDPSRDFTNRLQDLLETMYLTFFLEPTYDDEELELEELEAVYDSKPEKLCQGLPNLGNTCYMNAVLQSLFSIPSFTGDLLSQGLPKNHIPFDALTMCFVQLLISKSIYSIKMKEKLLLIIKDTISAVAEVYSGNIQNDAHEFLGHCLDLMKDIGKLNAIGESDSDTDREAGFKHSFVGRALPRVPNCPIITNFEFELLRTITCKSCGHVVLKTELSNYLSLNLPQGSKARPLSIQCTLDLFFAAEELEYKCEKCMHKLSYGVHRFSRLPRVLIIHLKRYIFDEFWSLMKDGQEVIISKYIDVSPRCHESTKPPFPLSKFTHIRDSQILKIFKKLCSRASRSGRFSRKSKSRSKYSRSSSFTSSKKPTRRSQILTRRSLRQLQKRTLVKDLKPKMTEAEVLKRREDKDTEEDISVVDFMMATGDTFPVTPEVEDQVTSTPETDLHVKAMSENPNLEKDEGSDVLVEFNFANPAESTDDFYETEIQAVTTDENQLRRMRVYEQALRSALFESEQDSNPQWYTGNGQKSTKMSPREVGVGTSGASGLDKSSERKKLSDKKKTEFKEPKVAPRREEPKLADMGDHAYRLIGVVSHVGNTPASGHYISDAYDFEQEFWYTYNDLHVSDIQEAPMQEARLSTGYIFFYMHNKTFEEQLVKVRSSEPAN